MEFKMDEIKRLHQVYMSPMPRVRAPDLEALIRKYEGYDLMGWLISEVEKLRKEVAGPNLEHAFQVQALRDKAAKAERDALMDAVMILREHAEVSLEHKPRLRKEAERCCNLVLEAARRISVDTLNEKMEDLTKETSCSKPH